MPRTSKHHKKSCLDCQGMADFRQGLFNLEHKAAKTQRRRLRGRRGSAETCALRRRALKSQTLDLNLKLKSAFLCAPSANLAPASMNSPPAGLKLELSPAGG